MDDITKYKVPLETNKISLLCTYSINHNDNIDSRANLILLKYPVLTSTLQLNSSIKLDNVPMQHSINTGTIQVQPCYFRPRPLTGIKLQVAKSQFQCWLNAGIVRRLN